MSRTLNVKVDGHDYEIPEIWIAGFCKPRGRRVEDAILHWHHQSQMAASDDAKDTNATSVGSIGADHSDPSIEHRETGARLAGGARDARSKSDGERSDRCTP